MNINILRKNYKLEWENHVIEKIELGYTKSDAEKSADNWLEDKYMGDEEN